MTNLCLLLICFVCSGFTSMEFDSKILPAFSSFKIDIVAPSGKPSQEELREFKSLGYLDMNFPQNLIKDLGNKFLSNLSNSDEMRFKFLKEALYKDDDNIIWCLRGGYGAARIISYLYSLPKPTRKKTFIGYSDITALHLFFSQEWGWNTIHGAVAIELVRKEKDLSNFMKLADIIARKTKSITISDLKPVNKLAKEQTNVSGLLTGGNITLIQTSIGTKWQIKAKDKIIFFEDIGLIGYRLDRILHHLLDSGIFNGARAIIFGQFTEADKEIDLVIKEFSENKISIPVYRSSKFGHGNINQPLIYNSSSEVRRMNDIEYELIMQIE